MPDATPAPAAAPSPSPAATEAAPIIAPVAAPAEAAPLTEPTAAEAIASFDITKYTDSQVAELESGDPERINKVLGITVKPKEAVADAPNPAAAPAAPAAIDGETIGRVSLKALKPELRAAIVLALEGVRSGEVTPEEAFAKALNIKPALAPAVAAPPPAAEVAAPAPSPAPVSAQAAKVTELEASLVTLKAQYDEAKRTFNPEATEILESMTDVKMDLRDARREAAEQARADAAQEQINAEWRAQQAIHHQKAMDEFSDLITDPESGFLTHCDDEIYLAERRNDPILNQPDWQEKIGQRVKAKFFSSREVQNPPAEQNGAPIPPAPRNTVRLPGSPVGGAFSNGGLSLQAAEAEFNALPWDQRLDILGKVEASTKKRN